MIGDLLPPGVAWAERFADDVPETLFPAELELIAKAVPKRRREFATGRWCARQALHQLGVPPAPILPGPGGAPGWPPGITGSITHCDGYRAAVVTRLDAYASPDAYASGAYASPDASASGAYASPDAYASPGASASLGAYASVGVDAEPNEPLPPGVLDAISLPEERDQLGHSAPGSRVDVARDRLLFSAKESIYKAWFPLARRWLDFTEARVELRDDGTFSAKVLVDGPVPGFEGRWLTEAGLLLTAVTVPR